MQRLLTLQIIFATLACVAMLSLLLVHVGTRFLYEIELVRTQPCMGCGAKPVIDFSPRDSHRVFGTQNRATERAIELINEPSATGKSVEIRDCRGHLVEWISPND